LRTLIWNGRRRNAPDMPPMEVKNEITREIRGGSRTLVVTPDMGKVMFKMSIGTPEENRKKPDP
jgi:hypothetical protein